MQGEGRSQSDFRARRAGRRNWLQKMASESTILRDHLLVLCGRRKRCVGSNGFLCLKIEADKCSVLCR